MNRFVRQFYRRLFPLWVKNALNRSITELERFHPPKMTDSPPGRRVVVLAPHPDDESIGCGGTVAKYSREVGVEVLVVFLTDGRLGDPGLREMNDSNPRKKQLQEELAQLRKSEAAAALSALGIREWVFLNGSDGELHRDVTRIAPELAEIFAQWRPDTVLLPFLTDRHADHFAANRCLIEAVSLLDQRWPRELQCLGYEIWSPIYANLHIDITDTMAAKRKALACYQSQLKFNAFIAGVEGLNRFRAVSGLGEGEFAEGFFIAPYPEYERLYRTLLL